MLLLASLALLMAAGCAVPPPTGSTMALTAGAAATDALDAQGPRPVSPPAPAPANKPAVQGTQATTGGNSAAAVKTSLGKTISLSSFEGDLTCTRLVAPFELSDNAAILSETVASEGLSIFGGWLEAVAAGSAMKSAGKDANASARHKIPLELRAKAVRMNWLPMSAETYYGRLVLDRMGSELLPRDSRQGVKLYPQAQSMLDEVLKGVDEPYDYQFQVFIRESSGENALALPGGFLVLDAALVREPRLRQKALFALSHEVAHVLQRHETRALQARLIDAVSLVGNSRDLLLSMSRAKTDPGPLFALLLSGKLQFERHFADQELHSDGCAVRILDKSLRDNVQLVTVLRSFAAGLGAGADSGPGPGGAQSGRSVNQLEKLEKVADDMQTLVTLVTRPIDRHPAAKERIDNLNRTLKELSGRGKAQPTGGAAKPNASTQGSTIVLPPSRPAPPTSPRPATAPAPGAR